MIISFSPVRMDTDLTLSLAGDVLTVNGAAFDFAALTEAAVLPRAAVGCDMLASDVTRLGGQVQLTLILPVAADAPLARRYPAPVSPDDGPVTLPPNVLEEEVP